MANLPKIMTVDVDEVPVDNMTVTVNLQFTRLYRLRFWAGVQALKFITWIWSCDIELVEEE